MDIRTHGKDFEKYYERGKNQGSVRSLKVYDVQETPSGSCACATTEEGGSTRKRSTWSSCPLAAASEGGSKQAEKLGLQLNEYGFAPPSPSRLQPAGVYVAGAFESKDIPNSRPGRRGSRGSLSPAGIGSP